MWDNFARLTARLAKSHVLFNNLTIYLDFSAIFSRIAPNRPLTEGRHLGATFCRRGATFWLGLQRYATVSEYPEFCIQIGTNRGHRFSDVYMVLAVQLWFHSMDMVEY